MVNVKSHKRGVKLKEYEDIDEEEAWKGLLEETLEDRDDFALNLFNKSWYELNEEERKKVIKAMI